MRVKGRDNVSLENGDCLSKMPTATAEQLNIAKMLSKPGDDADLRSHVQKLQELTECTEDQAVTALYDCENNLERAVELLLDRFRCGTDEEWHTTGKKSKPKNAPTDVDTTAMDSRFDKYNSNEEVKKSASTNSDCETFTVKETRQMDQVKSGRNEAWSGSVSVRRDGRGRRATGAHKSADHRSNAVLKITDGLPAAEMNETIQKPKTKTLLDAEGWDPYTEYGEWTGEAIEVVNSNASIDEWCPEQSNLPPELFVDTEHSTAKDATGDNQPTSSVPSVNTTASPSLTTLPDTDSLFISKAFSKPPPRAFAHLPDVPVFIVPDLLPRSTSRWAFKFGAETGSPVKPKTDLSLHPSMQSAKESVSHASCAVLTQPCYSKSRPEGESQDFSSYVTPSPSKSPTVGFDVNKSNTPRSLLEDPARPDAKVEQTSNFTNAHFQNVTPVSKNTAAFSSSAKTQPSSSFEPGSGANQNTFLEPSFKNYLLDDLSNDVNKLSVGEPTNTSVKPSQFNLQQPVSQGPQTQSYSHNQGGSAVSMSNPLSKAQLSHISAHSALHSQQPIVSSAAPSQQPPVTLPPGMPHFISQFAPPAYHMFNLPGSSSNAPALFDFDQLQLIQQQQRMLYDMHLQHQAATTAQSLLPSAADSTSTSKPSSHNVAGSMGHVTAAGAGIRPDILASAMGHAPQMLAPGHPYFSYPGLVFMNGYTNAFLNQQQQQQPTGQDTNQSQSSTHCGSPITQPQAQSSGQPQSFSGLKQVSAGVGGYDDLLDMKYGDPSKQVGFKNNSNQPNYGSFQTAGSADSVGPKMSAAHQSGNFNPAGGSAHTHFPPQFYSPAANSPYLTAAAVAAAAAAAAASVQQQQQTSVGGVPSGANPNQSNPGGSGNTSGQGNAAGAGTGGANNATGQLHLTGNPAQPLVLGAAGGGLHHRHHQRSVIPH
ncbi:Ubiquitin-associated protein 2 [Fasciola gigantica]|uniref:Ubiquitin-associated protein 2 n=1 Tax=Fasciola gigantica TaxID=46835 RepID=A0A504YVG2_FASGI|nr:Ubiquitin-associated protein 2 [Fasciola gigantica]